MEQKQGLITANLPASIVALIAFVLSRTGQIVTVRGSRPMKLRAAHKGADLRKESVFQVRLGVEYENLANTQAKRESGELPAENTGLPSWAELLHDDNGKVLKGLLRNARNGTLYLRGKPNSENPQAVRGTRFLLNGHEVDKATAQSMALASEFKPSNGDWIYYKLENVESIK